jgi:SAM-dependent methyltransferase
MALDTAPACPTPCLDAYEELAPYYDILTASYDHERWLGALEQVALRFGLTGRRLLDAGCGTGKSFVPMLRRGYDVTACDLSPAMVARARGRHPDPARVFVADARSLPAIGPFDLVTFIDDAVNYLLGEEDLESAFAGFARVLSVHGVLVFDANTLATYRSSFASEWVVESSGARIRWRGLASATFAEGELCSAVVEAVSGRGRPAIGEHVQRHHPRAVVERCCARAGLTCVAALGQLPGVRLSPEVDEELHTKVVYVVRKTAAPATGR